jgi:ribosomal protein S18 acetylase RimI-like enzyme
MLASMTTTVHPAGDQDAEFLAETLRASWGGATIVAHDEEIDVAAHLALVAWRGEPGAEQRCGLLTYRVFPDEHSWEVLTLDAVVRGAGVGTALLAALRELAVAHAVRRIWLITTNENTRALRFYQRFGFDLTALHRGAADRARKRKPAIPREADGIRVRHELELSLTP